MPTIDIDFEVFKVLTMRRISEADSYDDVIRRLLALPANPPMAANPKASNPASPPWVSKGVTFLEGSEFRANYKGEMVAAHVKNGRLMYGTGASSSLSHAARLVTNTSVDGWTFWEVKRPADIEWRRAGDLRKGVA
jgi:hypothetical protein